MGHHTDELSTAISADVSPLIAPPSELEPGLADVAAQEHRGVTMRAQERVEHGEVVRAEDPQLHAANLPAPGPERQPATSAGHGIAPHFIGASWRAGGGCWRCWMPAMTVWLHMSTISRSHCDASTHA